MSERYRRIGRRSTSSLAACSRRRLAASTSGTVSPAPESRRTTHRWGGSGQQRHRPPPLRSAMHQHNRSGRRHHRRLAGCQHRLCTIHLPGRKIVVEDNRKTLRQPIARKLHRRQQRSSPSVRPAARKHACDGRCQLRLLPPARSPRCRSRRAGRLTDSCNPAGPACARRLVPPRNLRRAEAATSIGSPGSAARMRPRISSRAVFESLMAVFPCSWLSLAHGCASPRLQWRQRSRASFHQSRKLCFGTARRSLETASIRAAIPGSSSGCPHRVRTTSALTRASRCTPPHSAYG